MVRNLLLAGLAAGGALAPGHLQSARELAVAVLAGVTGAVLVIAADDIAVVLVVSPGHVVVLGDNRPTSWDSRHYGFVPRDRLVGVAIRRFPPPGPR